MLQVLGNRIPCRGRRWCDMSPMGVILSGFISGGGGGGVLSRGEGDVGKWTGGGGGGGVVV